MTATTFLALDLGAESGRAMSGSFDGARLVVAEIHRFPNRPAHVLDGLHWDVLALHTGILDGLAAQAARPGPALTSVGVDTWGLDFALLAADDTLVGLPYHYRDRRTRGMLQLALQRLSREEIFSYTGVQFMELNTLYQLLAMRRSGAAALESATTLLMMPDLFNFWLSGQKASEWTIASTSQMCDPRTHGWSEPLLQALDLPADMLQPIVEPGTILGPLLPSVAAQVGLAHRSSQVHIVAPACHDTGSAVVAVPASTPRFGYISSGTWSLVGGETREPALGAAALRHNFTNEGGVDGTFRVLKNISGMWLVQECRRSWLRAGQTFSYAQLADLAQAAPAFGPLIDPNHPDFVVPDDMPAAIQGRCRATGQPVPAQAGEFVRCALESLALAYRKTFDELAEILGTLVDAIHIMGGGSQNRLLCQFTADACGVPVLAGPVEATAMGNLLVQMRAAGVLASLAEMREVVRRSVTLERYEPQDRAAWDDAYGRYQKILQLSTQEEAS